MPVIVTTSHYPGFVTSSRRSEALQFDFSRPDDVTEPPEAITERPERPPTAPVMDLVDRVEAIAAVAIAAERQDRRERRELRPGLLPDAALTVSEFYDRVRWALRAEFPDEVWVTGEIRKVTVSKGNRYLELADPGVSAAKSAPAMLDVACWSRDWPLIGAELRSVGLDLSAGLVVRIRGKVSVWDGGAKLRFSMTDLDVTALVGGIAAARRKLLTRLESEGLLTANRQLPLPLVPMKVGIVTSAGSEAYRDFTGQLTRSGFAFDVRLESC